MRLTEIKKEKLVKKIYEWVVKDVAVGIEKERLLKVMIEATLDYLHAKGYLDTEKEGKGNGEK